MAEDAEAGQGVPAAARRRLAGRFDGIAGAYAASRPSYPEEACDFLLAGHHDRVLDLAAGSGALTRLLVGRATTVVAAEPSANLAVELATVVPAARVVRATAESLPFADKTFDVVTVATAFHWFDPARALPDIARVLRPAGLLSLTWNTRAVVDSWTARLDELFRSAQPPDLRGEWATDSAGALERSPLFASIERAEFAHAQELGRAGLVALVSSRSYVAALDDRRRQQVLTEVATLYDEVAGPDDGVELPYRCQCWRAVRG